MYAHDGLPVVCTIRCGCRGVVFVLDEPAESSVRSQCQSGERSLASVATVRIQISHYQDVLKNTTTVRHDDVELTRRSKMKDNNASLRHSIDVPIDVMYRKMQESIASR